MMTPQEQEDFIREYHDFAYRNIAQRVYFLTNLHKTGRYREITDDIFDSFFVHLITHEGIIKNWRGESSFKNYLYTIIKRFTIREFYRNHLPKEYSLDDNPKLSEKIGIEHEGSHPDPEPPEKIRNHLEYLIDCLRKERDRRFIRMYYFQEKSYEEISRELDTPVENLYLIHHRALRRLRKIAHQKKNWRIVKDLEDFRNSL